MRNNYEVRAKKFLEQIAPFLDGCKTVWDYIDAVTAYNQVYKRHVLVRSGATRVALITSDYVIKINCGDSYKCKLFGNCASERRIYKEAEKDGFAYLFAKTTPVICNHKRYYIMPRVRNIGRCDGDVNEYLTDEENDWLDEHGIFDLHFQNYGWNNGYPIIIDYAAC